MNATYASGVAKLSLGTSFVVTYRDESCVKNAFENSGLSLWLWRRWWCLGYWYSHSISWQSPRLEPGTELIARLRFPTPTKTTSDLSDSPGNLGTGASPPTRSLFGNSGPLAFRHCKIATVIAGPTACKRRPDKTLRTLTSRFKCHLHQLILIFCSEHQAYQAYCGLRLCERSLRVYTLGGRVNRVCFTTIPSQLASDQTTPFLHTQFACLSVLVVPPAIYIVLVGPTQGTR